MKVGHRQAPHQNPRHLWCRGFFTSAHSMTNMLRFQILVAGLGVVALLSGCTALLPDAKNTVQGPWSSFEDARATFANILPNRTTQADLHAMGLDARKNPNITLLNYSDVIRRFVPPSGVDGYSPDPAVLECIRVRSDCQGYELNQKVLRRDRYGNFWLDFFNFNRKTKTTGWEFNAVWLVKDGVVIYKLIGGKPQVQEDETRRNPLGPLQGIETIRLGD